MFTELEHFAATRSCNPTSPPKPLILAGWIYSNDADKNGRWSETLAWASENGCQHIVDSLPDDDFYFAESLTTYAVSPAGGPMYLPWDFRAKPALSPADREEFLERLRSQWVQIAGTELSRATQPLSLTGRKGRRLLVAAKSDTNPPWGTWESCSRNPEVRLSFTRFRASVNASLAPHQVDHIDFTSVG